MKKRELKPSEEMAARYVGQQLGMFISKRPHLSKRIFGLLKQVDEGYEKFHSAILELDNLYYKNGGSHLDPYLLIFLNENNYRELAEVIKKSLDNYLQEMDIEIKDIRKGEKE
jgi:hypothetical protein